MALITVKVFKHSIDAHLVKSKLESEGIVCYLFDEHATTIKPNYIDSDSGIKLKINDFDLEKAKFIYNQINPNDAGAEHLDTFKCARCESNKKSGLKQFILTFLGLLLAVFSFRVNRKTHCQNCGARL